MFDPNDPKRKEMLNEHAMSLQYINTWFGDRTGKFLDIGSHTGGVSSMTAPRLQLGWHGVMVEPTPQTFRNLENEMSNKGWTSQVTCVNRAVMPNDYAGNHVTMYDMSNMVTQENSWHASWRRDWVERAATEPGTHPPDWDGHIHELLVPVITCNQLIDQYGTDWDLIKIDAEGLTLSIVQNMPWHRMQVGLVCIEREDTVEHYASVLPQLGFTLRHHIGWDLFFSR